MKKLTDMELANELPNLNDKLSQLSHSEVGTFLGEFYQDQILKKCMIILRQDLVELRGETLINKLSVVWSQFYTSILPTLQAIFAPVQVCVCVCERERERERGGGGRKRMRDSHSYHCSCKSYQ